MNELLFSVAEISNTFSVLTVLLALVIMVVLILRLHNEDMFSQMDLSRPPVPASPMVMVHNPFLLKCQRSAEDDPDGITCSISSQVPWFLQVFWGVNVADLHQILYSDWNVFKELLFSDGLLLGSYLHKNELKQCNEEKINLISPSMLEDDLGPVPRTKYPLIVFMIKDDSETDAEADTVAAMISIIHIKDSKCNMESGILMQYLKQSSGNVSCLKPLYVASDEERVVDADETSDPQDVKDDSCEVNLCVICQCEEITMALLPCRHTCVCADCFKQIDKCPMCRSFISTYFFIKDKAPTETDLQAKQMNTQTKLEHYMRRLNSYLGFN